MYIVYKTEGEFTTITTMLTVMTCPCVVYSHVHGIHVIYLKYYEKEGRGKQKVLNHVRVSLQEKYGTIDCNSATLAFHLI